MKKISQTQWKRYKESAEGKEARKRLRRSSEILSAHRTRAVRVSGKIREKRKTGKGKRLALSPCPADACAEKHGHLRKR